MQKAQERREARDAARRDRLLAQAASVSSTAATSSGGFPKRPGPPLLASQQTPTVVSQPLQLLQPIPHQQAIHQSQLTQGIGTPVTMKPVAWDLQQPWTPFGVGPARNHQQHGRFSQQNNRQDGNGGEEEEEDYDDDDDEDDAAVVGSDGAFHLTAPRGFRYD